ncbi:acyl carrier protein [Streptomyces sp. 8N114]|uniref:acyl carrier protein n=1 Tax=unclassified Streptomyces TaxID=2593676 RepID=UPI003FD258BA
MSSLTQEDRQKIKEIVCDILEIDPDELSGTSRFKEDHDADSLRAIEILAGLEKEFDVTIEQSELAGMVNLEGVYNVVSKASEK